MFRGFCTRIVFPQLLRLANEVETKFPKRSAMNFIILAGATAAVFQVGSGGGGGGGGELKMRREAERGVVGELL